MKNKLFFSLFVYFFILIFLSLGFWQIIRLNWKLELIDSINTSLKSDPVTFNGHDPKNFLKIKCPELCRKKHLKKKRIAKSCCSMHNSARRVFKIKPSVGEMVNNAVFYLVFEGSKTENLVFSLYNMFANLLLDTFGRFF